MSQIGIFPWSRPMPHNHSVIDQGGNVPLTSITGHNVAVHDLLGIDHATLGNVLEAQHHALPDLSDIINACVCRAFKNGAQVIPSGVNTKILYADESFDIGNNFAGNQFTAPSNGYYLILSHASFMNLPAGSDQTLDVRVAGVVVSKSQYEINVQATECYMECVTIQYLTTGQIVSSYIRQNSGADKSMFGTASQTYISIIKLGV